MKKDKSTITSVEVFLSQFNIGDKIKRPDWEADEYVQILSMSGEVPYFF